MEIIVTTVIVEMLYVLANAANVLTITTTLVSIPIALHAVVTYLAAKINVTNVATTICLETTILETTILATTILATTILEIFLEVDLQEAIIKMEAILVPENELIFNVTNEYLNLIDSKVKDVFQERNKQI